MFYLFIIGCQEPKYTYSFDLINNGRIDLVSPYIDLSNKKYSPSLLGFTVRDSVVNKVFSFNYNPPTIEMHRYFNFDYYPTSIANNGFILEKYSSRSKIKTSHTTIKYKSIGVDTFEVKIIENLELRKEIFLEEGQFTFLVRYKSLPLEHTFSYVEKMKKQVEGIRIASIVKNQSMIRSIERVKKYQSSNKNWK